MNTISGQGIVSTTALGVSQASARGAALIRPQDSGRAQIDTYRALVRQHSYGGRDVDVDDALVRNAVRGYRSGNVPKLVMSSLPHVAIVAKLSLEDFTAVMEFLLEQAKDNPGFLKFVLPKIHSNMSTLEDLTSHAEIVSRVVDACGQSDIVKDVLPRMAESYRMYEDLEAWLRCGMAWVEYFNCKNRNVDEIHFGVDPAERRARFEDRDFTLKVLEKDGKLIWSVDDMFSQDPDVILAAFRGGYVEAWEVLDDPSLMEGPEFQREAFAANFNTAKHFINIPPDMAAEYNLILSSLMWLNVSFPERFNTRSVNEVIHNRRNPHLMDPARTVLMLYPKMDHNGAFRKNHIAAFISHGWQVLYFEVGSVLDIRYIKNEVAKIPDVESRGIPVMIAAAHSSITLSSFGDRDPRSSKVQRADRCFDATSLTRGIAGQLAGLSRYLSAGSVVCIEGCGAGGGRDGVVNVANAMSAMFPQSTIFSPTVPINYKRYVFGDGGRLVDVEYADPDIRYVISPRESGVALSV